MYSWAYVLLQISIMWRACAILAVGAVICASQPVEKLPVLKELPAEVNFSVPNKEDLVLNCETVDKDAGVKYSWVKDGKPFSLRSDVTQKENEGTLIFKKPVDSDEGKYQCLAETKFGVASSRIVLVKKIFIDKPQLSLQKHKPVNGRTYKLECAIPKSYPKPEISWIVKTGNEEKPVAGAKFTISPEGTLYIASVSSEDVGNKKYVCLASTPAVDQPLELAEHVLEEAIQDKEPADHEVVKQYVSNEVVAEIGKPVYLYCIYGGNPLAHPDWFKDGKDINNSPKDRVTRYNKSVGKRLLIKEVWFVDQGEYTCKVNNEVGKPQEHTMRLKVISAPQFLKNAPPKMIVKPGSDVDLPCHVTGTPAASLTWTYNAQPLKLEAHSESQGNTTVSTVTLKNVTPKNNGYYGCSAQNEHGTAYVETLLYVQ